MTLNRSLDINKLILIGSHAVSGSVAESYESPFIIAKSTSRPAHETIAAPFNHGAASSTNARVPIPANVASGQRAQQNTGGRVPCDLCQKDFAREADMIRHQNDVHELASKAYVCAVCGHGRCRKDKMKEHGIKEHGESTPDSYSLRELASQEYVCVVCGVICDNKDKMKEHGIKEHGESTLDSYSLQDIDQTRRHVTDHSNSTEKSLSQDSRRYGDTNR